MESLLPPEIEAYVEAHTTPAPAHLAQIAEETRRSMRSPQMLSGLVEGRLLEMLVWISGARHVIELGTYSGHSALAMASALGPGGRVITCESDPEHAAVARRNIGSSPYADRVEVREGAALELLEAESGPFDLAFVDADKVGYGAYFEALLPKLAPRGLMAIDNTLWSGRVLSPAEDDASGSALATLNDRLAADERVVCVQLTVRDGVTLVRRA